MTATAIGNAASRIDVSVYGTKAPQPRKVCSEASACSGANTNMQGAVRLQLASQNLGCCTTDHFTCTRQPTRTEPPANRPKSVGLNKDPYHKPVLEECEALVMAPLNYAISAVCCAVLTGRSNGG